MAAEAWFGYNTLEVSIGGRSVVLTYVRGPYNQSDYERMATTRKEVLEMIKEDCKTSTDLTALNKKVFDYISSKDIGMASFTINGPQALSDVRIKGDAAIRTIDMYDCQGQSRIMLNTYGSKKP